METAGVRPDAVFHGAVGPVQRPSPRQTGAAAKPVAAGTSFRALLEEAVNRGAADRGQPLHFSGHARSRLETVGVRVSDSALVRLKNGVERAAAKGARESLILVDDLAFVVSVKNRTVITAIDRARAKDHVFTNIDSAVIA